MGNSNLSIIYGILALFSALLCTANLLFDQRKNRLFLALFGCVAAANSGYFLMAICNSLAVAKIANGVSYFGGAFSILVMLLIVYDVCRMPKNRWFCGVLVGISIAVFALAASGDWLGLYYRSVSLGKINGMTILVKEYGPLHILYAVYLLSYMLLMAGMVVYAAKTKRLDAPKYTLFLLVAVLLNLGVWLVEQLVDVDFEFLSVSYIVTAVLLLLIYGMLCDYGIVQPGGALVSVQMLTQLNTRQINPGQLPPNMEDMFRHFAEKVKTLSAAERRILNYYIAGHEMAELPELVFISINTVKKHNRSIYQKLEIASRDELMLYIELFRCCDRLDELIDETPEGIS
jgi:DNA-binding CsgD family transcriptional regulator